MPGQSAVPGRAGSLLGMTKLTAHTSLGDLRGAPHHELVQFRGVPYAEPPVAGRRFRPPEPIGPWEGTLDATQHGPIAPQAPSRLRAAIGDFSRPQDEDCLTLTITTPAPDEKKRRVVVWLHGGGYNSGAGSLDWYDPVELVRAGDVVVVSVNYRLGPLGYLYYDGLADGRMGLRDMIEAIRWTAAHIEAFGGDPGEITLMGQSAGAHSILCVLALPEARSLFRRVVLASAPAGLPPLSAEQASERTALYLDVLGLGGAPPEEVRRRLEDAEPARLIEADRVLARDTASLGRVEPPFFPVVDDLADPDGFLRAAALGAAEANIAVMIGTNRDEALAMAGDPAARAASREDVDAYLRSRVGPREARRYWRSRNGHRPADALAVAVTDIEFERPSLTFAEQAAWAGARVFAYRLDWSALGSSFGACHCLDLPLVFGVDPANVPMLQGLPDDSGDEVARLMREAWTSFAVHGRPGSSAVWPAYDVHSRHTMIFDETCGVASDPAGIASR